MFAKGFCAIFFMNLLFNMIDKNNCQNSSFFQNGLKFLKKLQEMKQGEEKNDIENFDPASLTALALTGLNNRNRPIIIQIITKHGDHIKEYV